MTKRMRVFAGPNGSGKSSIIKNVLKTKVGKGKTLDFGIYVNADDLAVLLLRSKVDFSGFRVDATLADLRDIALKSGLINKDFPIERFDECILFDDNSLTVNHVAAGRLKDTPHERIAQILADYLRKKLLEKGEKFSFETVFSHASKVEIIRKAKESGYKVYLYFVSTEDPEINVYRVKVVRVSQHGHDVDRQKIVDRYYRSMALMYEAAQHCYQSYFFDNSKDGGEHSMFAHFKINKDGEKQWDPIEDPSSVPLWFRKYYSNKIK